MKRAISRLVHWALRKRGYRLYKPVIEYPDKELNIRYEHVLALEAFRNAEDFFFVQIGANDGVKDDPIREFVLATKWRGLLIEPIPTYYQRLVKNYSECTDRLFFENCAIGDHEGYQAMFRIRDGATGLPAWATGLASFDRAVLEKVRDSIPSLNELIVEDRVRCSTLKSLLSKYKQPRIDLLQIDAEGYDYYIIRDIDLDAIRPRIVHYESKYIAQIKQKELMKKLIFSGYKLSTDGHDTLAVQNYD
jgi:FkbM family methyltransferase